MLDRHRDWPRRSPRFVTLVRIINLRADRTDRVEGRDIYHNEDIIEISIVARVAERGAEQDTPADC